MGTHRFADEIEAVVGCWAGQCRVKVLELAGPEFCIRAREVIFILPCKSLAKYISKGRSSLYVSVLRDGLRRRRQFPRKAFRK